MAARFPLSSRFPNGFAKGVEIHGMPVFNTYAGEVYWVSATDGSDGNKGTRNQPFATVSKAISTATAKQGDVVAIAPGHKETISDAVNINKEGLTIVGVPGGAKPRFRFSGGNASDGFDISANYVTVANVECEAGLDGLTAAFDIDATNATLSDVTFSEQDTDLHWVHAIVSGSTTDNVCDGLKVVGCDYHTATDSNTGFINVVGDIKGLDVVGNRYTVGKGTDATGIFIQGTAGDDIQDAYIADNVIQVTQTATDSYPLLSGNDQTDNSGMIVRNLVGTSISNANATSNFLVLGTGFRYAENYQSGAAGHGGNLHPTATN